MRSAVCLIGSLVFASVLYAQEVNLVPLPKELKKGQGSFPLSSSTVILVKNGVDDNTADFFNEYLMQYYGIRLKKTKAAQSDFIQFTTLQTLVPGKEGAYSLFVTPAAINIRGQTASGTFYGMQTLIQLLPLGISETVRPVYRIPAIEISDEPRFAYRGMHLDVGRHFFPVAFVKKYIDYLALHKFNTFHWHLTEDQGWRIEIKKYPRLTEVGAWRNGTITGRFPGTGNDGIRYGGYYTQEEIKEVVKYAADRFIDVIPEVEMPGHSSAAIAAYPELSCFPNESTLYPKQCAWNGDTTGKQVQQTWGVFNDVFCAGKENSFQFLQDVLDEVIALFPSKYVHVGGDECPKENWKRCPYCQQRIKDNGLVSEHELQSYFIQRIEKFLNSKGRTLIGWDEILEGGLAPNAIVMSWRGEKGGIDAAKQKHFVIMTPGNPVYFDHSQSKNEDSVTIGGYNPIEKVYAYEPVPKELRGDETEYVLGAQANVWTEYMAYPSKVEYMIFPRMAALSEVLWSPEEKRDWRDFEMRLQAQFRRYDLWKANYSKAYFDLRSSVLPMPNGAGFYWSLESKLKGAGIYVKRIGSTSVKRRIKGAIPIKTGSSGVPGTASYIATLERNGKILSTVNQTFHLNKATGKKITLSELPSAKYPGDGAFTLVNGVQNEKGLARSNEFIAFEGPDCEATIDLGKAITVNQVIAHSLDQRASWIWPPASINVFSSGDNKLYSPVSCINPQITSNKITCEFVQPIKARYVKLVVQNYGIIPDGNPGAGNRAWLFLDEIEIE